MAAILKAHSGSDATSPFLLALIVEAQGAIENRPEVARRCLEQIARVISGDTTDAIDRLLIPSVVSDAGRDIAKGRLAAWQIRRVREHVEARLEGTILIEDLAAVAKLSPGHFCRAFKVSTGETPHGYVVRQRIRRAQRLMLSTEESLSQIACACGLTDQAHLTRLFRRLVNDTPLAWRRARRVA